MKSIHLFTYLILSINIFAQKYDANWVLGNPNWLYKFDSSNIFKSDTFASGNSLFFFYSSCSMSDSKGNLLFISNGLQVNDKNDNLMEGGDQLLLGAYDTTFGYDFRQSPLSLPMPGSDSLYVSIR